MHVMLLKTLFGLQRGIRLDIVFSYNSPVHDTNCFFPRDFLSKEIISSIEEPGTQLLVYGERYVGKTSLIYDCFDRIGVNVLKVQCFGEMSEQNFIRGVLNCLDPQRLDLITTTHTIEGQVQGKSSIIIAQIEGSAVHSSSREEKIKSWVEIPTISDLVKAIAKSRTLLFIDDAERLRDNKLIRSIGDLAKAVSDSFAFSNAGKLVLSFATSDLSKVPNCLRAFSNRIRAIKVPRMNEREMTGLIRWGMIRSCLKLSESVIKEIVRLSEGIPRTAKLLCLEAGRAVAESVGIQDQRLFGNEQEVTLEWFRNDILPNLRTRGLI